MTDLKAIVARDAEIDSGDGFSVLPFVSEAEHDRRALLALLRETRDALAALHREVGRYASSRALADVWGQMRGASELLSRLAALDTEVPVDRS